MTPETLHEKLERLAAAAEREAQETPSVARGHYCEGTAHGLREAARMVSQLEAERLQEASLKRQGLAGLPGPVGDPARSEEPR